MTWEIWRFSDHERGAILEVLSFGDDDGAARQKFAELQEDAMRDGGAFEMRCDGKYISYFSCSPPPGGKRD